MAGIKRILPFMQSPNITRVLHISVVVVTGVDEGINEAHHRDSILEAS